MEPWEIYPPVGEMAALLKAASDALERYLGGSQHQYDVYKAAMFLVNLYLEKHGYKKDAS